MQRILAMIGNQIQKQDKRRNKMVKIIDYDKSNRWHCNDREHDGSRK